MNTDPCCQGRRPSPAPHTALGVVGVQFPSQRGLCPQPGEPRVPNATHSPRDGHDRGCGMEETSRDKEQNLLPPKPAREPLGTLPFAPIPVLSHCRCLSINLLRSFCECFIGENNLLSPSQWPRLVPTLCQHSGAPRQCHHPWHEATTSPSPNPKQQLEGAEAPSTARAVEGSSNLRGNSWQQFEISKKTLSSGAPLCHPSTGRCHQPLPQM